MRECSRIGRRLGRNGRIRLWPGPRSSAIPEDEGQWGYPMREGVWRWETATNGVPLLAWDRGPVHVRCSSRFGGTSPAPWDSFNIGFSVGDEPERVRANRLRLFEAIGVSPARSVWAEQVHGGIVAPVGLLEAGRGSLSRETSIPGADGLLTESEGLALGMGFADCVPVVLADPGAGMVALCHAGWRGTVQGVVRHALAEMVRRGATPEASVYAAVGPAIGGSYQVDEKVVTPMRAAYPWADAHFDPESGVLDLVAVNVHALLDDGVPPGHVAVTGERTECPAFFSHRTNHGRTGRMATLVWIAS